MDIYYNPAQRIALRENQVFIDKGFENLQYGLSFYYVAHFGNFETYAQAGYYLKTEDEEIGSFYQIVGGRVKMSDRFDGIIALKTHFAKAEYLMLGIGVNLGKLQ